MMHSVSTISGIYDDPTFVVAFKEYLKRAFRHSPVLLKHVYEYSGNSDCISGLIPENEESFFEPGLPISMFLSSYDIIDYAFLIENKEIIGHFVLHFSKQVHGKEQVDIVEQYLLYDLETDFLLKQYVKNRQLGLTVCKAIPCKQVNLERIIDFNEKRKQA